MGGPHTLSFQYFGAHCISLVNTTSYKQGKVATSTGVTNSRQKQAYVIIDHPQPTLLVLGNPFALGDGLSDHDEPFLASHTLFGRIIAFVVLGRWRTIGCAFNGRPLAVLLQEATPSMGGEIHLVCNITSFP